MKTKWVKPCSLAILGLLLLSCAPAVAPTPTPVPAALTPMPAAPVVTPKPAVEQPRYGGILTSTM